MPDTVNSNSVVTFHYKMLDEQGALLEESDVERPVVVLQGFENIVRGVDRALMGRSPGETFGVTVPPEDGYGMRREGWTQRISKKHLPRGQKLRPGMQTAYRTENGIRRVTVVKVGAKMMDVDLNHPLAGRELHFEITVTGVREAEASEISHGHAHGPGGHEH